MDEPSSPEAPTASGTADRDTDGLMSYPSHPPPEATAITDDGQLHLLILRSGGGEQPPMHARCLGEATGTAAGRGARRKLGGQGPTAAAPPSARRSGTLASLAPTPLHRAVHYVGRLADSGELFMDTRRESQAEEPEVVVAGRGERRCGGWVGARAFDPFTGRMARAGVSHTCPPPHHPPPSSCRHRIPGGGAEPCGGGNESRRPGPRVGRAQVRLRPAGQLLVPHRAP